jgi:hypothetical protein
LTLLRVFHLILSGDFNMFKYTLVALALVFVAAACNKKEEAATPAVDSVETTPEAVPAEAPAQAPADSMEAAPSEGDTVQ